MKQTNILTHLAAAVVVTILSVQIYTSVQQVHRSTANDPQLQIAGDIATRVKYGGIINQWFDKDTIEISQSLSPFNTLYNDKNEPVLSSGVLHGKTLLLPSGVFDFARKYGEDVFTWQPEKGLRFAVVLRTVQAASYSFIAVGRALYEVEKREQNLVWMVFLSWLLCMGVILFHWLTRFLNRRKNLNN